MAARVMFLAALLASAGCAASKSSQSGPAPSEPRDGVALLSQMREAYKGRWFKTVTFIQQTIVTQPTGAVDTSTWYEALLSPDRLRIDFGDPKNGNGALYTADSLYVVRAGKITRSVATGNPFLPFVAGVYDQPIDTTVRQIKPYKFDLTRLRTGSWQGRPIYVVGTESASDTTSPQFWIDRERLIAVRVLLPLNPAAPAEMADIHLDDYVEVSGGWLATKVDIILPGDRRQREQYSNWKGNVDLPRDFFVAEKWSDVRHWYVGDQKPR